MNELVKSVETELLLKEITGQDMDFLCGLYRSTREDEMKWLTDWSERKKDEFINQQFEAQHRFYMEQFADAHFWIIMRIGEPIGRLYLDERSDELRIIDISLIPACRGKGLGTHVMKCILQHAGNKGLLVRIHVEKNNRALTLYRRLGFIAIEDKGVYLLMEWQYSPHDTN